MYAVAKVPSWYGFPGNVTPQHPQNRILPSWRGTEPMGTVNLRGLRAGGYQGSLGYVSAQRGKDYDLAVLELAGLRGLRGPSGLGEGASTSSGGATTATAEKSAWDYVAPIGNAAAAIIGAFTGNVPSTGSTTTPSEASDDNEETTAAINALQQQLAAQQAAQAAQQAAQSQTTMYIAIGVGAVALLGLGYVLLRKKG